MLIFDNNLLDNNLRRTNLLWRQIFSDGKFSVIISFLGDNRNLLEFSLMVYTSSNNKSS